MGVGGGADSAGFMLWFCFFSWFCLAASVKGPKRLEHYIKS